MKIRKRKSRGHSIAKATYEFWNKGSAKQLTAKQAFRLAQKGLKRTVARGSSAKMVRHLRDYGPKHYCESCDL